MKIILHSNNEILFSGAGIWRQDPERTWIELQKGDFSFSLQIDKTWVRISTRDQVSLKAEFGPENRAWVSTPYGDFESKAGLRELRQEPDSIFLAYWVMDPETIITLELQKETS